MQWNIIGQKNLVSQLEELAGDSFPQFSIVKGSRGGGKTYLAYRLAELLGAKLVPVEKKVDSVREIIPLAHRIHDPILFLLADGDEFSNAAKNALLKITEEPPQNARFLLTLVDENKMLDTIKSRAVMLNLDPYTPQDLYEYCTEILGYFPSAEEDAAIREVCIVPADVSTIIKYDIVEFYLYAEKVLGFINKASKANIFKISTKIDFKDGTTPGWNYKLFMQAVMQICMRKFNEMLLYNEGEDLPYPEFMQLTSRYKQEMEITGINKEHVFDMWLMAMAEAE